MPIFKSLLAKFVLIALPVFIVLNTGFLFGYAQYRIDTIRAELATEIASLSYRLGNGLSKAAATSDGALATSILQTVAGNRSIRCAIVRDAAGDPLAAWPFPGCDSVDGVAHKTEVPILHSEKDLGALAIHYDETWVREALGKELGYIAGAILFASLVAFLACIAAHRLTIGRPLGRLTAAIERRKSDGIHEIVDWTSQDELGNVVTAYNQMTITERERLQQLTDTTEELKLEIRERERAEQDLRTTQIHLVQASKLEAMGTLAAGIAHEINTPLQYLTSNLRFLKDSFASFVDAFNNVSERRTLAPQDVATIAETYDLDFLKEEVPSAIDQGIEGVDQVAKIVRAVADFSDPGQAEKQEIDLPDLVANAVKVSTAHWKDVAEVRCESPPSLPKVEGYSGEIGQVLLNLILNAADAIAERSDGKKGVIGIKVSAADNHVEIGISDTGPGIPPEHLDKIFDMFFTTKDPGKGTGQGLAMCQSIIMKKHGGSLSVMSEMGVGTTFNIRLPVAALALAH